MQVAQWTLGVRLEPMIVLQVGEAQGFSTSTLSNDFPAPIEGVASWALRRRAAHSPALEQWWAVSVRWSRQNVPRHDSHRKGRKSS